MSKFTITYNQLELYIRGIIDIAEQEGVKIKTLVDLYLYLESKGQDKLTLIQ